MKTNKIAEIVAEFNVTLRESVQLKSDQLLFISKSFPEMQCFSGSYLLAFHLFKNTDILSIDLICGYCDAWQGEEEISHYWLEVNGLILDITADQYNLIEDSYLHQSFIDSRPFAQTYCIDKNLAPHSYLFVERERTRLNSKLTHLSRDDFMEWEHEYSKVVSN